MVLWLTIKLPIGDQNTNWKCPTENPKQKKVSCNHRPKLQVAKTARWQKLLADLFSPKPQPTMKKKLSLLHCHALPDLMPPLDKSPSPVGGRQRNSRATPIHPSTTLSAKRFARFALLSMNKHTPTSQQIYQFFYRHRCIFFNWSWG